MSARGVDTRRRRFLTGAVTVVGGVGTAFTAWPFASAWQPSERARAIGAPVEVDISKLEPGQRLTEKWQGQPGNRHDTDGHTHIDGKLKNKNCGRPDDYVGRKTGSTTSGDSYRPVKDIPKQGENYKGTPETKFFSKYGENEIGMTLREEIQGGL